MHSLLSRRAQTLHLSMSRCTTITHHCITLYSSLSLPPSLLPFLPFPSCDPARARPFARVNHLTRYVTSLSPLPHDFTPVSPVMPVICTLSLSAALARCSLDLSLFTRLPRRPRSLHATLPHTLAPSFHSDPRRARDCLHGVTLVTLGAVAASAGGGGGDAGMHPEFDLSSALHTGHPRVQLYRDNLTSGTSGSLLPLSSEADTLAWLSATPLCFRLAHCLLHTSCTLRQA